MLLTGQIALTRTNGRWSELIREVTQSDYNHTVIAISETKCIGAEPGGVRIRPISDFPIAAWSQFIYRGNQRDNLVDWAEDQEGVEYSYVEDLLIGVALLTRSNTPGWIERRLSSGDSWQCAAMCDAALMHVGIYLFRDTRPVGAVYPGSFVPFWRDFGWLPKS